MRGKIKTNKIVMSIINKIEMETIITNDLDITSHSSIGEFLGSGGHRNVYMFNLIPNTVIKIEFRGYGLVLIPDYSRVKKHKLKG